MMSGVRVHADVCWASVYIVPEPRQIGLGSIQQSPSVMRGTLPALSFRDHCFDDRRAGVGPAQLAREIHANPELRFEEKVRGLAADTVNAGIAVSAAGDCRLRSVHALGEVAARASPFSPSTMRCRKSVTPAGTI
jgi:hypothetical protein